MAYIGTAPIQRNTHLIPATLALLFAGVLSALHISFLGQSWPLLWLPLIIVALWPRQAGVIPSALILFVAGLWLDWTTIGAPGQWPLVFLTVYAVMRPDRRDGEGRGWAVSIWRFCVAFVIGIAVFVLSGRLIYGVWPDLSGMTRGFVIAILALPVIAYLRDALARRLEGDD